MKPAREEDVNFVNRAARGQTCITGPLIEHVVEFEVDEDWVIVLEIVQEVNSVGNDYDVYGVAKGR